jgi:small subunit ribosomal protein S20
MLCRRGMPRYNLRFSNLLALPGANWELIRPCWPDALTCISKAPKKMPSASKVQKTVRIASGRKRVRQDVRLNAANSALRSKFRTAIKGVLKAVQAGDKAKASDAFKIAQSVIDSIANKGIFHKNKAARHKSRLSAKIKALPVAA